MTSGWATTTIGEACSVFSGGTPSKANDSYWRGDIPWVSAKDLKSDQIFDAELHISAEACAESAAKMAPVGSLLVLVRGMGLANGVPIGEVTSRVAFNQDIRAIVPPKGLNSRFLQLALRYAFTSSPELLSSAAHGTLKIDAEALRTVSFPVPTQTEQQRIVAILDEAFEGIATAKANAEKNLQNALALFEGYSRSVFNQHTEGAARRELAEVCSINSKLVDPRNPAFLDLTHVGAGNIVSNTGELVQLKTAREEELISGKFLFDESTVLYSKIRPYLMKVARPDFNGLCSADMYPLTAKAGALSRDFLFHLLLSKDFTDYAITGSARAGMPKVNREHLFAYTSWIPPLAAQVEIAETLDALHAETQALEAVYRRKLTALEELKKSLLHQAFSGQLTSSKQTSIAQQPALQTTTPEFTANVISIAHARHERLKREKTFGRVKEQKTLHLIESIAGIDLGRQPMRDAAGPNDFQHMLKAEEWAQARGFFEMVKTGEGYEFRKLSKFDEHMSQARQTLAPYLSRLEPVIDLLVPLDKEEAEVFATVHAAWNNLLIDGVQATDDAIVLAARQDWHPDKLKIQEHKFRIAIESIRRKKLVPTGSAKYVGGQTALFDES
ncbi:restriction endonuclease subunit S [Variovorax sp. RB2P76]|uniref:restriction endonuclease subunit S n=1 Tax=Variovorax sp. RB2P76 TaxID=3443736 RepID=UPI003F455AD5